MGAPAHISLALHGSGIYYKQTLDLSLDRSLHFDTQSNLGNSFALLVPLHDAFG